MATATGVSAEQKAQLEEVAEGMLHVYQTLAAMRYIREEGIIEGPHNIENLRDTYAKHNLDPAIIYLYSILPYIDEDLVGERDFIHGGTFVDFRDPSDVERSRDPFYMDPQGDFEHDNGSYMRPWATPLSNMGNHGTVVLYDAKLHRIWLVDQEGWGTTDRALCSYVDMEEEKSESDWGGDTDDSSWEEDENNASISNSESDDGEETIEADELDGLRGDQAEEVEYDEGFDVLDDREVQEAEERSRSKNQNSFEHIRSRPAGEVLRDIKRWYYELKELPGQGEHHGELWMQPSVLQPLYLKHGWPETFDGDAFEIGQVRAYAVERAKYNAEEPLRQVQCYEGWLEHSEDQKKRYEKEIVEAKTFDEEWTARFELWRYEEIHKRNLEDLEDRQAKAEQRCPGGVCQKPEDLPLWELEQLRVETHWKLEAVSRSEEDLMRSENDPAQHRSCSARLKEATQRASVYSEALKAAEVDAECMCPGKTFEEATGIKSLGRQDTRKQVEDSKMWIEWTKKEIAKLKGWVSHLPDGVPQTRAAVNGVIQQNESSLESLQKQLERTEKWLAEHGNTD